MYLHKLNPTRDQLSRVKVSHRPIEAGPYLPVPAEQGLARGQAPVPPPLLRAGASEEHQHHHTCSSEAEGRRRCEGEPNSGLAGAAPLGMDLMSSVSK